MNKPIHGSNRAAQSPKLAALSGAAARSESLQVVWTKAQAGLDAHFAETSKGEDPFPGISLYWPALGKPPRRTIGPNGELGEYDLDRIGPDAASIVLLGDRNYPTSSGGDWKAAARQFRLRFDGVTFNKAWIPPEEERRKLGADGDAIHYFSWPQWSEYGDNSHQDGTTRQEQPSEIHVGALPKDVLTFVAAVEKAVVAAKLEFLGMTYHSGSEQWRVEVRAPGYHAALDQALKK